MPRWGVIVIVAFIGFTVPMIWLPSFGVLGWPVIAAGVVCAMTAGTLIWRCG